MNRKIIVIRFWIYILTPLFMVLECNVIANNPNREKVYLSTDRTLYIIGENIHFSAFVFQKGSMNTIADSKVLYVELISPEGQSLSSGKFLVEDSNSNGMITIPDNLLSGIYYLKAYTKWMRNFDPKCYCYQTIKIINPYKKEFVGSTSTKVTNLSDDSIANNSQLVKILTDKTVYQTRGTIKINISFSEINFHPITPVSVSVIPKGSFQDYKTPILCTNNQDEGIEFAPETKGVTFSGKVINVKQNIPIPSIRVNLSVLGNEKDIVSTFTDSLGKFVFGFPNYFGKKDLYINAQTLNGELPKILVDNDFCQKKLPVLSQCFDLTDEEKEVALKMAKNAQLDTLFHRKRTIEVVNKDSTYKPFYGEPQKVIVFDRFIQLPTVEEYFSEFIGDVEIKKKNGKRFFRINGNQVEMQLFEPLVMIDLIPVDNHDQLLKVNPHNISCIEIINKPYVKGNNTYAGIISFFSKKHDFAGIELPNTSLFINYNFLTSNSFFKYDNQPESALPDSRNTLYWNPQMHLNTKNNEITFKTGDTPGQYTIVVRYFNTNGDPVLTTQEFDILK